MTNPEHAPLIPVGSTRSFALSRRVFLSLVGTTTVGAAILAACGGGNGGTADTIVGGELPSGAVLVRRFPADVLVPGQVRLPISIANTDGLISDDDDSLPSALTARILDIDRKNVLVEPFTAIKHKNGVQPYYPFTATLDTVGFYVLQVQGGPEEGVTIQIRDRSEVTIPLVDDDLPSFDTPTLDNARGVTPICTRPAGTCPFHKFTLAEALTKNKPVVYLIGTPAYCQTGTCAPALDALIQVSEKVGDDMVFVHADVYTDNTASKPAPAVEAYNMTYEPALFVTDSSGTLQARLDAIFDVDEIRDVLAAIK